MDIKDELTSTRSMVSMPVGFTKRMKKFSEKEDIPFSNLIRSALKIYTNDDDDCFIELAKQHAGSEATDNATEALIKHKITQSHFLGHILKEATLALSKLKEGQDWHEIKFTTTQSKGEEDFVSMLDRFETLLKSREQLKDEVA